MSAARRPGLRAFLAVGLLVTLLVAGGLSYFASSHPDGLEHVAGQTGFLDSAEDSPTAGSPLADYQTSGVEHGWLSGALAGVAGVALVLLLTLALTWLLRRRGGAGLDAGPDADTGRA